MYSNVELTAYAFRSILNSLVDMEERKDEIVCEFYPEPSEMRCAFSIFVGEYLKKLEELVKTVQIVDKPDREKLKRVNYLPYVIIGSRVELEVLKDKAVVTYRVVSPYHTGNSIYDISYLSDLGRTLLLKELGEVLYANIGGVFCTFRIKSIRYEL